ncbi:MAG: hypothetical protein WBD86_02860 [Microgenomates group bacterium]
MNRFDFEKVREIKKRKEFEAVKTSAENVITENINTNQILGFVKLADESGLIESLVEAKELLDAEIIWSIRGEPARRSDIRKAISERWKPFLERLDEEEGGSLVKIKEFPDLNRQPSDLAKQIYKDIWFLGNAPALTFFFQNARVRGLGVLPFVLLFVVDMQKDGIHFIHGCESDRWKNDISSITRLKLLEDIKNDVWETLELALGNPLHKKIKHGDRKGWNSFRLGLR